MLLLLRAVLALSALTQVVFGLLFLLAPGRIAAWAGLEESEALGGLMINLGCLVLFVAWACVVTFLTLRTAPQRARRWCYAIGLMLLIMGALQAANGSLVPLAWDGGRGLLLLLGAYGVGRARRASPPPHRPPG